MADEQGAIPEALGPLWRKVQQVHTDAMSNDRSVAGYRAGMAAALGITPPAADRLTDTGDEEVSARERRAGGFLFKKAREDGWKDDGEGAYEYMVRRAYEAGMRKATPKPPVDAGAMLEVETAAFIGAADYVVRFEAALASQKDDPSASLAYLASQAEVAVRYIKRLLAIRNLPDAGEPL